jgi:glycosyltransferase involved in cell wall biosynthesis
LAVAERKKIPVKFEDLKELKVALVHYWLVTWRGGEKVLERMLEMFPKADVYTLFYDEKVCGKHLGNHRVFPSRLNLPILKGAYQKLFPFYPLGIKSLKLDQTYDLIISSESGPAKGIGNPTRTPHLCYIHTPMRYCWGYTDMYLKALPTWARKTADRQFKKLRDWDLTTVNNVDLYVANSNNVANRVKKYYGKEARTCYPPIALDLFESDLVKREKGAYLSFGALTPYKNIELLVETFKQMDRKLIIIGEGSEKGKLEKTASSNIQFKGKLPMDEVLDYIRSSRALLFPGEEDFGMVPLEVMSQGVPVIAYGKGGALETVVENTLDRSQSSGLFFRDATTESLTKAIREFESFEDRFDPVWIKNHARKFGEDVFEKSMSGHILDLLNKNY